MADLAKLVVKLEADNQKLVRQLDSSKRKISRFEKSAAKSADRIGRAMKRAGKVTALGAAAAVTGLTLMINAQRKLIDEQAKTAQQLDTTVASIANLTRAGELGGVSIEKIATASRTLNVAIGDAIGGLKAQADAFDKLGLSAREIFELPLDQRIAAINKALRDNVSAAERAAIAADLFGTRNGAAIQQLDPETIAAAARQVRLFGLNLSDVDAAKVEQANDAFSTFGLLIEGIKTQLTVQLAPVLKAMGDNFLRAAEEAGGLGNQVERAVRKVVGFAQVVTNLADLIGRVFSVTADLIILTAANTVAEFRKIGAAAAKALSFVVPDFAGGDAIKEFSDELEESARVNKAAATSALEEIRAALTEPLSGNQFAEFFQDAQTSAESSARATVDARKKTEETSVAVSQGGEAAANATAKLAGLVDQMRMQAATADLSEGATLRYRLSVGDLSKELETGGQAAQRYGDQLTELSFKLDEQARAQAKATAELDKWNTMMSEGEALAESVRTPAEKLSARYEDLNNKLEKNAISQEVYNRAVAKAQDDFDKASKGAGQFAIDLEEIGRTLGNNIQNSLADFLFDPFADGTKSMGEQFSDLLKRMAADVAAASIMQGLFGGGAGGGGGGLLGAIGGLFAGARAEGGPVNASQPYLVGERGPEMFIPASQGNIANARETESMGGQVTVNVTTPNADSFRSNRRQISREIKQGVSV